MFKKGDRVRFIHGGVIGWETKEYHKSDNLEYGKVYTVEEVDNNPICILLYDHSMWHHPDHFMLSDEHEDEHGYIVKMTQDEVDAISLSCSLIGGSPYNSSRRVLSNPDMMAGDNILYQKSTYYDEYLSKNSYLALTKYRDGKISFNKIVK